VPKTISVMGIPPSLPLNRPVGPGLPVSIARKREPRYWD
jgi:hypothetical protein